MPEFFSRDELLDGLPARQASTILFAIESRTAYLAAQSRQAAARYVPPKTAAAREHAFLQALAEGRDLPYQVKIQDLERYAPEWAALVPDNPGVKAVLANMLAQEYTFTSQHVPGLRQALSLDDPAVQQAYQRNYDQPLPKIYALRLPFKEQLRWLWAGLAQWLEELPPFWTAYALTLTETVGASILALPIALAGIGPVAGVVLLLILGLVNILTIMGVVEAITRNGNMRYGSNFFGRLVGDYLGQAGTVMLTTSLVIMIILIMLVFYVGVATTLADATGLPGVLWAALLFTIVFYYLRRESLDATVASALVIGAVNLGLIVSLSLVTLPHIRPENFSILNVPLLNGRPLDPSILALIFGVVLTGYFGHTSAANAAKIVLRRNPSGNALMGGNVAAMATVVGLYCLWVAAINGAIPADILANTSGTALIPLARVVGPVVVVLGTLFVILGMGMVTIHFSLALFNQVREWLPAQAPPDKPAQASSGLGRKIQGWLLSRSGRFWVGFAPLGLIFLWTEWLLWSGQGSFTEVLAIVGVITVPLLGGVFPMLMLAASRRKGDYVPVFVWRFLGHPVVVLAVYLIFWAGILLYGLVIWTDLIPRLAALAAAGVILVVTVVIIRRGAFTPRTVVELRANQDTHKPAVFTITSMGQPLPAEIILKYKNEEQQRQAANGDIPDFKNLRAITFHLPPAPAKELKLWLHQLTPEDFSESLSGRVTVQQGQEKQDIDLASSGGQAVLPLNGEACRVEIVLVEESVSDLLANL
jgi:amino acid permease